MESRENNAAISDGDRSPSKWPLLIAFVLVLICSGVPQPADRIDLVFVALAALPWVAMMLVARYRPAWDFGFHLADPTPVWPVLTVPGAILTWRALDAIHALHGLPLLPVALLGGVILTASAMWVDPSFRDLRFILVLGVANCAYGYGVGLDLDTVADSSPAQVYRVKVLDKYERRSEGVRGVSSVRHYLRLDRWGPVDHIGDVSVSVDDYELARRGAVVCLALRSGALRVAWYRISPCP
ncbi:MAG TPA: hypothetical protein VMD56_06805 [Steroidobacteraceae bacterium]|nr:hypothetical protein [Steroidobacteraceae bacterium]